MKTLLCFLLMVQVALAQFDVVVVPENYTRQEQTLFNSDVEIVKAEWAVRLPKIPVNFIPKFSHKTSFRCVQGNSLEGSYCNDGKVADFTNDLHPDLILVLVDGHTGGGYRNQIAVIGTSLHTPQQLAAAIHEIGHGCGLPDGGYGIMGATANSVYNNTFTPEQLVMIKNRTGATSNTQPIIHIASPLNGYTTTATGSLMVMGDATDTQWVEIYYDGVLKSSMVFWDRNPHCNSTGIKFWIDNLSPGSHSITMTAKDAWGMSATETVSINIQ